MSRPIMAIDPGPKECGYVVLDGDCVKAAIVRPIHELIYCIDSGQCDNDRIVVEKLACMGMAVGAEVFETAYNIGEIRHAWRRRFIFRPIRFLTRNEVKLHLCQSPRAKDANIRQAIIDRYGGKDKAIGNKKNPGPLYGVKSHCWAALALAITAQETEASGG